MSIATTAIPPVAPTDSTPRALGLRRELMPMAVCLGFGLLMATLPHLLWWQTLGAPHYVADHDDLDVYLALGATAYFNHPTYLSDPILAEGGTTLYPWLQMVPGILVAKALDLGPLGINLAWRAWGGLTVALGWYLIFRHYTRRPGISAALSILLMSDVGVRFGIPLATHARLTLALLNGGMAPYLDSFPEIHAQWRIVTPALSIVYLQFFVWLLARAIDQPSRGTLVAAGIAFGFCFYEYFYYWTAAGLSLLLGVALDSGRRRIHFLVGCLGTLIGMPAIIDSYLLKKTFSPDFLPRIDNFFPIGRFDDLLIPKGAIALFAFATVWVWARHRRLIHIWCLVLASLLLTNHQVVTGLQIQNYHWGFVWGPVLVLLLTLLAWLELDRAGLADRTATHAVLFALTVLIGASGLGLRAIEATQTRESVDILNAYSDFVHDRAGAPPLEPRAVVAGDPAFVGLALVLENTRPLNHYTVLNSPSVGNDELDERIALDGFLSGLSREEFEKEAGRRVDNFIWGKWASHRITSEQRRERINIFLAAYDRVAADPAAAIDRYEVRYLAAPADQPAPEPIRDGWKLAHQGSRWSVWRRESP